MDANNHRTICTGIWFGILFIPAKCDGDGDDDDDGDGDGDDDDDDDDEPNPNPNWHFFGGMGWEHQPKK